MNLNLHMNTPMSNFDSFDIAGAEAKTKMQELKEYHERNVYSKRMNSYCTLCFPSYGAD